MDSLFIILILLFTKHFVVDFPLQTPYQWQNKGTYGHLGGILHSGLHALATLIILLFFISPEIAMTLGIMDGLLHYHIDWAKTKINKHFGWLPDKHPEFWVLLGLDQYLHALTYLFIIFLL